ncbi:hypothetical protein M378DRAFT_523588 [Amanita muscaria Koide BX008]|uniref:Uncharacterized protein n=1 Tax=Amanita muscaria (strain Koide BX008) TaxID=946122 RepID=A0A0C2SR03_AMAMK|nr:hypothetical protein M378DRAFT_523588 [Amanita muscaria Koide BX008]
MFTTLFPSCSFNPSVLPFRYSRVHHIMIRLNPNYPQLLPLAQCKTLHWLSRFQLAICRILGLGLDITLNSLLCRVERRRNCRSRRRE